MPPPILAAFLLVAALLTSVSGGRARYTQQALERLSEVFGIDEIPKLQHHRSPPEYMMELYNSVAFSDGVSKRSNPYHADVVRGFPDRAVKHQTHYYFNVSYVAREEGVIAAEFRLYKTRPAGVIQHRGPRSSHVVQISLYQVLSEDWASDPSVWQLLGRRRVSAHVNGWLVFNVTQTVTTWVNDSDTNYGFLVTATSLDGTPVNGTIVRFAQRLEHHDSKQPVLVVFSGGTEATYYATNDPDLPSSDSAVSDASYPTDPDLIASLRREYIQALNEGPSAAAESLNSYQHYMSESQHDLLMQATERERRTPTRPKSRVKRSKNKEPKKSVSRRNTDYYRLPGRRKHKACQRNELYVDFDEIGWSGWIISPKGYNAYHCWGECPFPLGQFHRPTNHATVQSIVYTMRIEKSVQLPCCVPDKLFSISLLYFDDEENVILKQYDEMVAASCGCH